MTNKPNLQDEIVFWSIGLGTLCFLLSFTFCMIYPSKILFVIGSGGFAIALLVPLGLALYNSTTGK